MGQWLLPGPGQWPIRKAQLNISANTRIALTGISFNIVLLTVSNPGNWVLPRANNCHYLCIIGEREMNCDNGVCVFIFSFLNGTKCQHIPIKAPRWIILCSQHRSPSHRANIFPFYLICILNFGNRARARSRNGWKKHFKNVRHLFYVFYMQCFCSGQRVPPSSLPTVWRVNVFAEIIC